jgi:hypothetical protein
MGQLSQPSFYPLKVGLLGDELWIIKEMKAGWALTHVISGLNKNCSMSWCFFQVWDGMGFFYYFLCFALDDNGASCMGSKNLLFGVFAILHKNVAFFFK